jgi:hypothetical protein
MPADNRFGRFKPGGAKATVLGDVRDVFGRAERQCEKFVNMTCRQMPHAIVGQRFRIADGAQVNRKKL